MGTKGTLLAGLLLACAPVAASAQGVPPPSIANDPIQGPKPTLIEQIVPQFGGANGPTNVPPPKKPFVGPPVELAGSDPPAAIVIGAPTAAETASNVTGAAGGALTLVEPLTNDKALLGSKRNVRIANEVLDKANRTVAVVGVATSGAVMYEKCKDTKEMTADCLQASGNTMASTVGLMQTSTKFVKTPVPGAVMQTAADAVGVYKNCFDELKLECVQSGIDMTISASAGIPAVGQGVSAGYSIAKVVAPALVGWASDALYGKELYAAYYDLLRAEDESGAMSDATSDAAIKAHRAKLRERYQQAKTNLETKQRDYDAERLRAEIERQARIAAQQASQQNAMFNQAMFGGLMGAMQGQRQMAGGVGIDCGVNFEKCAKAEDFNTTVVPAANSMGISVPRVQNGQIVYPGSAPPSSSGRGCVPREGHVCTVQ